MCAFNSQPVIPSISKPTCPRCQSTYIHTHLVSMHIINGSLVTDAGQYEMSCDTCGHQGTYEDFGEHTPTHPPNNDLEEDPRV